MFALAAGLCLASLLTTSRSVTRHSDTPPTPHTFRGPPLSDTRLHAHDTPTTRSTTRPRHVHDTSTTPQRRSRPPTITRRPRARPQVQRRPRGWPRNHRRVGGGRRRLAARRSRRHMDGGASFEISRDRPEISRDRPSLGLDDDGFRDASFWPIAFCAGVRRGRPPHGTPLSGYAS